MSYEKKKKIEEKAKELRNIVVPKRMMMFLTIKLFQINKELIQEATVHSCYYLLHDCKSNKSILTK